MDECKRIKRMLNEILIRSRTLIAEIGITSDDVIIARHAENNHRLCQILDICDYDLDRLTNFRVQKILDDFFEQYDDPFIILDCLTTCITNAESIPNGK